MNLFKSFLLFVFLCAGLSSLSAQTDPTLEMVLRAIQERYTAVSQRMAVEQAWGTSTTVSSSNPDLTIFTSANAVTPRAPLNWGTGIPALPPEGHFDSFTPAQRFELLKTAYAALPDLIEDYLNVDPAGFSSGTLKLPPAAFTEDATADLTEKKGWGYTEHDLPLKPELLDHSDFQAHLYHLADTVSRLRCLRWPVPIYRRSMPRDEWWDGFIPLYSAYYGDDPFDYLNRYRPWQGAGNSNTTEHPEYIGLHNLAQIQVTPANDVSTAAFTFKNAAYAPQALTMMQNMLGFVNNWTTFTLEKNMTVGEGEFNTALFEIPALSMTVIENQGSSDYFLKANNTFSAGGIRYFNDGTSLLTNSVSGQLYRLEHITQQTRLTIEKNNQEIEVVQETVFIQDPEVAPTGKWITQAQAVTSGQYEQDPLVYGRPEGDLDIKLSVNSLVPDWTGLLQNDTPWTFLYFLNGENYSYPFPDEVYHDLYYGALDGYLPDTAQDYLTPEVLAAGITEPDLDDWSDLQYLAGINTYSVYVPSFTELTGTLFDAQTSPLQLGDSGPGMTPFEPDYYFRIDLGSGQHTRHHNARLVLVFDEDGAHQLRFLGDRAEYDRTGTTTTQDVYIGEALTTTVTTLANGDIQVQQQLVNGLANVTDLTGTVVLRSFLIHPTTVAAHPNEPFVEVTRTNHNTDSQTWLLGNHEVKTDETGGEYYTVWKLEAQSGDYFQNYTFQHFQDDGGALEEVLKETASVEYRPAYPRIVKLVNQTGLTGGDVGYGLNFSNGVEYTDAFGESRATYDHDPASFTWTRSTTSHTREETLNGSGWNVTHKPSDAPTVLYTVSRSEIADGYSDVLTTAPGETYTTILERWNPSQSLPAGQVPWGLKQITYPDGTIRTSSEVYTASGHTTTSFYGLANGQGTETVTTHNLLGDVLNVTTTLNLGSPLVLSNETFTHEYFGLKTAQDTFGNQQTLTRNAEGFLTSLTGHGPNLLLSNHDPLGRPETVEYPDQSLTTTLTRELNRTVVTDGTWTRETTYNSAGTFVSSQHTGSYQQSLSLSRAPDQTLTLTGSNSHTHREQRQIWNPETLATSGDLNGAEGYRQTVSWTTLNGVPCQLTQIQEREVDENGDDTFSQTVASIWTDGLGRVRRQQTLDPSSATVAYLDTDYVYNAQGQLKRIEFPQGPDLLLEYHPLGYVQFQTRDLNGNGQRDDATDDIRETEQVVVGSEWITRSYTYSGGVRTLLAEQKLDIGQRKLLRTTGNQTSDELIVDNPQPDRTTITFNGDTVLDQTPLSASWTEPGTTDLTDPLTQTATWTSEGTLQTVVQQQGTKSTTTTFDGNGDPIQTDDGETLSAFTHTYNPDLSSSQTVHHDGTEGVTQSEQPLLNTGMTYGKGVMPATVSTSRTANGGEEITFQRANGQSNTITLNPAGLPIRKDYSNGDWEAQTWTTSGQLASTSNSRNETQSWQYDATHDELVEWQVDGVQRLRIEPGDRNQLGLPLQMTDASGTRAFTYEEEKWSGLEKEEWTAGLLSGFSLDYTPDSRGRLHTHSVKKGSDTLSTSTYTYKGSGERMDTLSVNIPGAPAITIQYLGNAFQSGGVSYTVNSTETYRMELKRDEAERIDELDSNKHEFDADWQRNARGQIQSLNESGGSTSFDYHLDNGSLKEADGPEDHWGYTFNDSGELEELRLNGLSAPVSKDPQTGAVIGLSHGQTQGRKYLLSGNMHTNATVNIYLEGSTNAVHTVSNTNRYSFVISSSQIPALSDPNALVQVPWRVTATRPGASYEQNLAVSWIEGSALFPPENETVAFSGGRRSSDAFLSYSWDATDRVTQMTHQVTGMSTEHVYDAQDRRVEKRVYDNGDLIRTHRYVYEDWLPVCEEVLDAWGNLDYRNVYVYGAGPNGVRDPSMGATTQLALIAHIPKYGAPQLSAPVYNYRWDITGLIDVETGNVVARYSYSPFGKLLSAEGSRAEQNPFRFAGAYWDPETETAYFGFRHYDPRTKQFLNRDPIGEAGGMNLLAYTNNDPVNLGPDILGLRMGGVTGGRPSRYAHSSNGMNWRVIAAQARANQARQALTEAILQGQSLNVQGYHLRQARIALREGSHPTFLPGRPNSSNYNRALVRHYNRIAMLSQRARHDLASHSNVLIRNRKTVASETSLPASQQTFSAANRRIIEQGGSPLMLVRVRDPGSGRFVESEVNASNYFRGSNGNYFPRAGHFGSGFHERDVVQGVNTFGNSLNTGIFQIGVNITPRSVANQYRTIGSGGRTFVTEPSAIEKVIGPLRGSRISISARQARQLEDALGLRPNSLELRNIISIVDNIPSRAPGSPVTGNSLFQGGGAGLPGGGAELTILGIPSAGGQGIRQIVLEVGN